MPRCKNNSKRSFKGTEPSPKGYGFCASGAKVGQRKKGKDGSMWQVKKFGKVQRWVKCVTNKSMKPKKKSTPKKKEIVIFNMVFKWKNNEDGTYKQPSNVEMCRFFKSKWTKTFLDHYCQMMGVWIEDQDPTQVFDHAVDMKNALIHECVVKKNCIHLEVQADLKPYVEKNERTVVKLTTKNLSRFSNCLKDVFNFSIRAGGFLSKRYKKNHGDFIVHKITPQDWTKIGE